MSFWKKKPVEEPVKEKTHWVTKTYDAIEVGDWLYHQDYYWLKITSKSDADHAVVAESIFVGQGDINVIITAPVEVWPSCTSKFKRLKCEAKVGHDGSHYSNGTAWTEMP